MSNVQSRNCSQCGAPIELMATTCKFCGSDISVQPQNQNTQAQQYSQPQAPQYQQPQQYSQTQPPQYGQGQYQAPPTTYYAPSGKIKSKTTAGILGILLGGFGAHKFYLGKTGMGVLYLIFCWTYIPALVGFIEGILYLVSSEETFNRKYVNR